MEFFSSQTEQILIQFNGHPFLGCLLVHLGKKMARALFSFILHPFAPICEFGPISDRLTPFFSNLLSYLATNYTFYSMGYPFVLFSAALLTFMLFWPYLLLRFALSRWLVIDFALLCLGALCPMSLCLCCLSLDCYISW